MSEKLRRVACSAFPIALVVVFSAAQSDVAFSEEDFEAFPDFGFMLPASQRPDGDVFNLKHDYPRKKPSGLKRLPFLKIDFTKDWEGYIQEVRDYCFEGNIPHWNPFENSVRDWYHIPWLHPNSQTGFPPNGGTEGFRGLIKEAPVSPYQLGPDQAGDYQVYAITLINDFAGYTLGKMWKNPQSPDPRATDRRHGGGFPVGTVFCKLLFTDAPQGPDKIPELENPLTWTAYITESWNSPNRKPTPVNLLQMDVMVRDERADPWMGWVFGTFAYNGALGKQEKFMNLVPVGIQWGNDPDITTNQMVVFPATETKPNPELKQTVINPSKDLPPQHLGWAGRLNGPADLPTSSCMSCHAMAEFPQLTGLVAPGATGLAFGPFPPPKGGTPEWMQWFRNVPAATPVDERAYSTDFSLQIVISLQNFWNNRNAATDGLFAVDYGAEIKPAHRGGAP